MVKRLVTAMAFGGFAASAQAATYVVLPDAGSMAPVTVIVDPCNPNDQIFVCTSLSDVASGTCKLHRKTRR